MGSRSSAPNLSVQSAPPRPPVTDSPPEPSSSQPAGWRQSSPNASFQHLLLSLTRSVLGLPGAPADRNRCCTQGVAFVLLREEICISWRTVIFPAELMQAIVQAKKLRVRFGRRRLSLGGEVRVMNTFEAFLLGLMVAWTLPLIVLAWVLRGPLQQAHGPNWVTRIETHWYKWSRR